MSYKTLDEHGHDVSASPLVQPGDALRSAIASGKVCGECKYFSLREGQRLIEGQQFLSVLVQDHRWQKHHLGAPPETLGDCGAHRSGSSGDETMLTGPLHVACDQWRKR